MAVPAFMNRIVSLLDWRGTHKSEKHHSRPIRNDRQRTASPSAPRSSPLRCWTWCWGSRRGPSSNLLTCYTTSMARKLRIAVSAIFGLLTIALCVLWVRSYWWNATVSRIDSGRLTRLGLSKGCLYLTQQNDVASDRVSGGWRYRGGLRKHRNLESAESSAKFQWRHTRHELYMELPFWILATSTGVGVLAPWYRVRFSLRILLLATTLLAIALGLGAWLAR